MIPIFLASSSPRRKELLSTADVNFSSMCVDIDETIAKDESPTDYIQRMVVQKAQAALAQLVSTQHIQLKDSDKVCIITADTIGVLEDGSSILVKPKDQQHAMQMWQAMSSDSHEVWTAVCLSVVDLNAIPHNFLEQQLILEKTQVDFIELSEQMMQAYWHTGEPQDKAGGYAIQGRGAAWVKSIHGSYTNVVGLPLAQTLVALEQIQAKYAH